MTIPQPAGLQAAPGFQGRGAGAKRGPGFWILVIGGCLGLGGVMLVGGILRINGPSPSWYCPQENWNWVLRSAR
jgi:hypothetical protein